MLKVNFRLEKIQTGIDIFIVHLIQLGSSEKVNKCVLANRISENVQSVLLVYDHLFGFFRVSEIKYTMQT